MIVLILYDFSGKKFSQSTVASLCLPTVPYALRSSKHMPVIQRSLDLGLNLIERLPLVNGILSNRYVHLF